MGGEKESPHTEAVPATRTGSAQTWGGFSRYSSALLLFFTFCAVTVVGLFAIRDLRRADLQEQNMYTRLVLSLHRIAALEYQTQETRRSTLYALSTADSNLHVKYADQSREADHLVSEGITAYLGNAETPNEMDVGRRLERDWSRYLGVRDEVLASILEGSTKEAVDRDLTQGVASFDRVRQDLAEIERVYDQQASQQLSNVDATSQRTIIRVAGVLAITLIATIASVWTIQRIRMTGAIQLARLQMEFVASVSHELHTPLAVISSAADNIADGLVKATDDIKRYGAAIQNQSRQMTELVDQILLFSATNDRTHQAAMRSLDVSKILDSVIQQTSDLVKASGFQIELEIEPALPAVRGDASAMARCLQNMIVNAVKYSGKSRWIGVRAVLSHSQLRGRREVQVAVRDRGIGIAKAELAHVFEAFYRSPAVVAEQIHGTGLGLSVSQNIAEAMGGYLTVASELGSGSVFTLHLPIVEDTRSQVPPEGQVDGTARR
jgi:signal transduction histidine kinase